MSQRDNFSKDTISKLSKRVALLCSNPECRKHTSGPSSEKNDKVSSIGIAAHIKAASPGGPRFCEDQTTSQRKSIENGIWLCTNCATLIDRDVETYTVDKLNEWKAQAEEHARQNIGKKAYDNSDTIKQLSTAFTGQPLNISGQAIQNIHQAIETNLENENFAYKTSYIDGKLGYSVNAKDDNGILLKITLNEENSMALEKCLETGSTFEGNILNATCDEPLSNSIIEHNKNIDVKISPQGINCIQKIWIQNDNGDIEYLDDINTYITTGTKAVSISGKSFKDLLEINYKTALTPRNEDECELSFHINFNNWDMKNILHLPYFDKLFVLFKNLKKGWILNLKIEIDGNEAMRFASQVNSLRDIDEIVGYMNFINNGRIIAKRQSEEILFKSNYAFTDDDFKLINDSAYLYENKFSTGTCTQDTSIGKMRISNEKPINTKESEFSIIEPVGPKVQLFGKSIILPKRKFSFSNVVPQVVEVKNGFDVTIIAQKNCTRTIEFVD